MLITGPNAGGKSTLIKSLGISTLFAQTIGICFSDSAELTPFKVLNSYLNIPDCKGKESLFEAEMNRAREHIGFCDSIGENEKSFIIMDEIFNSTNPDEGISGATAIAEKLASYTNSISIITTHFNYLTNLESYSNFKNYKIPCAFDNNKNISYPYKLEEGISTQNIALELLRAKGFDDSIIDRANTVCSSLNTSDNSLESEVVADEAEPEVVADEAEPEVVADEAEPEVVADEAEPCWLTDEA